MTVLEKAGFYDVTKPIQDGDLAKLRLLLTRAAMRFVKLGDVSMANELDDFRLGTDDQT